MVAGSPGADALRAHERDVNRNGVRCPVWQRGRPQTNPICPDGSGNAPIGPGIPSRTPRLAHEHTAPNRSGWHALVLQRVQRGLRAHTLTAGRVGTADPRGLTPHLSDRAGRSGTDRSPAPSPQHWTPGRCPLGAVTSGADRRHRRAVCDGRLPQRPRHHQPRRGGRLLQQAGMAQVGLIVRREDHRWFPCFGLQRSPLRCSAIFRIRT